MRPALLQILALMAIFVALMPALDAGFYADDWFIGGQVAMTSHQGWIDRYVTPRWADEYQIFRPLGLWWVGSELSNHPDPRVAHLWAIALWCACALMVGELCAASLREPGARFLGTAVFGLWPASMEAVGWTAARPDLMCLLCSLAAIRCALAPSGRPAWCAVFVLLGLACKETAVVVPLIITWITMVGPQADRRTGITSRASIAVRRHAPSLVILALYIALRRMLFGAIGGAYQGESYFAYLEQPGAMTQTIADLADSLWRLVAPINGYAWARDVSLPIWIAQTLSAVIALGVGINWVRNRPALALALAPAVLLPIILMSVPLEGVGAGLERGRMLVMPQAIWAIAVSGALLRLFRSGRKPMAVAVGIAILLGGALLWRLALVPYVEARGISDALVAQLTNEASPGDRILVLNTDDPRAAAGGAHPKLESHLGCHLLSSGLPWAALPPFAPGRGYDVVRVPRQQLANLDQWAGTDDHRPHVATFVPHAAGGPRFLRLAPGGRVGPRVMLSPDHGSRVPVGWGGPLSSKVTTPLPGADRLRIVIAEPKIYGAFADEPMTDPSVMSHVPADRFSILSGGLPTGQTMNADVFRALPHGLFLWWAEYRAGEVVLARSPWALVRVAP